MFYGTFTIIVLVIITLFCFPFTSLEHRLEYIAREKYNLQLEITGLDLAFPLGFEFSSLKLMFPPQEIAPISMKQGQVVPNFFKLLMGKPEAHFDTVLDKGALTAHFRCSPIFHWQDYALDLDWTNILWKSSSSSLPVPLRAIRIRTNGDLHLQGKLDALPLSTGNGSFILKDTNLTLDHQAFPLSFTLESVQAHCDWELKQGTLLLTQSSFQGKGIRGDLTGRISNIQSLGQARADLQGILTFSSSKPHIYSLIKNNYGHTHFKWRLDGPVAQPRFRVNPAD
jgi:type II secretion system protein N